MDSPKTIIVALGNDAVNPCFCFVNRQGQSQVLSSDNLGKILVWASNQRPEPPALLFLADASKRLDEAVKTLLEGLEDRLVVPLQSRAQQEELNIPFSFDQTVVADSVRHLTEHIAEVHGRPVIVHVQSGEIHSISQALLGLQGNLGYVRLLPAQPHLISTENIEEYGRQLVKLAELSFAWEANNAGTSFHIVNIRERFREIAATQVKGGCLIRHGTLTIGPDGRGYLCPAFYRDSSKDSMSLAELKTALSQASIIDRCPVCLQSECAGCLYMACTETNGADKICLIYQKEAQASEKLMYRISQSGYLFDCLRMLKTAEVSRRSIDEGGQEIGSRLQMDQIEYQDFLQMLRDLKLLAQGIVRDDLSVEVSSMIQKRWREREDISGRSQVNIFRRRVGEMISRLISWQMRVDYKPADEIN